MTKLQKLRQHYGLRQIDLAELSGVSQWTIQVIESQNPDSHRGRQGRVRTSTAKLIADVFKLDISDLFKSISSKYLAPIVED